MRVTSVGWTAPPRPNVTADIRRLTSDTLVIVADPADVAIQVYRACGFADHQTQFSFERPPG